MYFVPLRLCAVYSQRSEPSRRFLYPYKKVEQTSEQQLLVPRQNEKAEELLLDLEGCAPYFISKKRAAMHILVSCRLLSLTCLGRVSSG